MTLENVTATYDLANAYDIAQQGEFVVTAEQTGSALVFSVPDPTVSVIGTVEGDTVTLHLTQELPEEAQADTFVADIVFQTDIPFCNETFGYYEMEGTYSGTGYIMFQPENLEWKIPDYCTWSGKFEAFVVATDDPPVPGSVAHIIADGSIQTLLNVDAFTDNLNVIEAQVIENILTAPTRADARQAAQDGIDQINDLKKATLDELQAIFVASRDAAKAADPKFRKNEKELWDCYLRNTAESRSTIRSRITEAKSILRRVLKNGGPATLPKKLDDLTHRTNATATNRLAIVAGTTSSPIENEPSMIFVVETNADCTADDIDFVQFASVDWNFINIDEATGRVNTISSQNPDGTEAFNANLYLQNSLKDLPTGGGEGAGGPGRAIPPDFVIGEPFLDVPLSNRQSGNPSYSWIAMETYNGVEYKGMQDYPHISLDRVGAFLDELKSGQYNSLFPQPSEFDGISISQHFETFIRCDGDIIGRWTWTAFNVLLVPNQPQGNYDVRFNFYLDYDAEGNPPIQPGPPPGYQPEEYDLAWTNGQSPEHQLIYNEWIDANGDVKQDHRNP
ncbi:MAG: hypothetical protein NUW37_04010 [Planctomycetes bacterium]|nr:hypothetical protein [Planctomycetota bacterium]